MCGPIWHGPIQDDEMVSKGIAALEPQPEHGSNPGQHQEEQAVHSANTQHGVRTRSPTTANQGPERMLVIPGSLAEEVTRSLPQPER